LNNGSCLSCGSYCQQCLSYSNCTLCLNGYSLINSSCLVSPNPNIATAQIGGVAVLCPTGCGTCTSTTSCTACLNGFALQDNICKQCTQTCLTCSATNVN
jgi:proprotein convertase subtilisin/kexin type 5